MEEFEKDRNKIDTTRRRFFKLFGKSSVAIGTIALIESCVRKPEPEKLLPYLDVPENIIPGVPYFYATTCSACPASCGILVKTEDAIARKIEGNPDHPLSGGKTCARAQALVHQLYSPDRLKNHFLKKEGGKQISTDDVVNIIAEKIREADPKKIFFITKNITGKTEKFYLDFVRNFEIPEENIIRWETFSFSAIRKASEIVFGVNSVPIFRIDQADFILSLSSDFLDTGANTVLYSRWFGKFISVDENAGRKNKFIHVSYRLNLTGQNAQKWIKVKPGGEIVFASLLLNKLIDEKFTDFSHLKINVPSGLAEKYNISLKDIDFVAKLILNSNSPLVVPPMCGGETSLCVVSLLINYVIGSAKKNISFDGFAYNKLATYKDISSLVQKMKNKEVEILFIVDNFDFVYTIPESIGIKEGLKEVPFVVLFSYHESETSDFAHLVVADRHPLEKWGDSEIVRGVVSFYQPVVRPLYDVPQAEDVLISVANKLKENSFPQTFKDYLISQYGFSDEDFVRYFEAGGIFDFKLEEKELSLKDTEQILKSIKFSEPPEGISFVAYPTYHLYDGRVANSPWIQEFFDVSNKVAWRNVVEVSKNTARKLGLKNGDIVEIRIGNRKFDIAVAVYLGISDDVVAVSLGRGHKKYGRFAGVGANIFEFLPEKYDDISGDISFFVDRISLSKTGKKLKRLPTNEGTPRTLGREGVAFFTSLQKLRGESLEEKLKEYEKIMKMKFPKGDWTKYNRDSGKPSPYKWGLNVDLDKCIGCQACMIACQVENNIPFVGEREVVWGREMTWIRIERYYISTEEILGSANKHNGGHNKAKHEDGDFNIVFVPMMCQQCGYAPCEYVCPVYATGHTSDGLNYQTYNRCVGTRFCANNCPYKVRYFNWHDYYKNVPEPLNMSFNPDVTVRSKGVMEKCTFCIQRIRYAQQNAKIEKREVRDGEITPACAQVCPTDAITFGNLKDKSSKVSEQRNSKRINWALLELGTEPAVVYFEKVFDVLKEEV